MYAYRSDVERLEQRLERLEELLDLTTDDPEFENELRRMICEKRGHKYESVAYDLQGGKWGKQQCSRCGYNYTWSV